MFTVAPRVGAWIETGTELKIAQHRESHPVWVRGLKLDMQAGLLKEWMSHPVWVRGLKLFKQMTWTI